MKKIVSIVMVLLFWPATALRAQWPGDNSLDPLTVGVTGGYGLLSGYYSDRLSGAYSFGLFCIPYTSEFFMGEVDAAFSRYGIRDTEASSLMSFSFDAGPVIHYPIFSFLRVYASVAFRGSVFLIDARNTGRRESTFKAGFSLGTGFYVPVMRGVHGRFTYRFSENDLSDRAFMSHDFSLGMSFSFGKAGINESRDKIPYDELKRHYNEGVTLFDSGDFASARRSFRKVLDLDRGHREAKNYLAIIDESDAYYREAEDLLKKQDYFGAIEKLTAIDPRMSSARERLARVREELSGRVKIMEEQCVRAYDERNYSLCIETCRKLLLVDPGNRTAGLYLERAQKRLRTMKTLE